MEIKEKVTDLVNDIIADSDLFIYDIKISGGNHNASKISILLDSDEGVDIDECASVSRRLSKILEDDQDFQTAYLLEVSSPGVDNPLMFPRQYWKHTGRELQITLNDGSLKTGKLEEVRNDLIIISVSDKKKKENQVIEIPFSEIRKSNVLVSFK